MSDLFFLLKTTLKRQCHDIQWLFIAFLCGKNIGGQQGKIGETHRRAANIWMNALRPISVQSAVKVKKSVVSVATSADYPPVQKLLVSGLLKKVWIHVLDIVDRDAKGRKGPFTVYYGLGMMFVLMFLVQLFLKINAGARKNKQTTKK